MRLFLVVQDLWEKTSSPAPVPPPIKPKPDRPITNRRKDKAEGPSGTKTKIKRKYAPIRYMYCGEVGHNKRTCSKKKQDDAQEKARIMQFCSTTTTCTWSESRKGRSHSPYTDTTAVATAAPDEQTEIPITQHAQLPLTQQSQTSTNVTQTRGGGRPPKLHVTRARAKGHASPGPVVVSAETIKGSSSATAKKLASFMTFVPTPGFKPPRKKDME
ncbi:hypothetical protein Ahy_B10g102254 [Arachis hypogaea]|uniref:CCHC-type domain-containing protein n=1 Tax=Arachis hypogaea TaxID=3818 RepID=A0A444X1D8_ARAHY|nr:hypothetical protein Ahy_B10g102254 [Arachis hypogaea]